MMPIYNEERTLPRILPRVLAQPEVGEVIAVDDGSTDKSWAILEAAARADSRVRPFRQPSNMGKGAALKRAIEHLSMPFALVQDADLEYDPADYPVLVAPLLAGRADVCYGAREFAGHTAYSFWFVMGGRLITLACNVLYNSFLTDILTGYKVLRSDLWRRLSLKRDGFDIDPEITGQVLRLGYRIHEVPINYFARSREEGKKVGVGDGIHALVTLLEIRTRSVHSLLGKRLDPDYHKQRQRELADQHPFISDEPAEERAANGGVARLRRVR
jgi:glycosyltransferase involved in cell wall biosynthesis